MDNNKLIIPVILLAGVTACSDDGDEGTTSKPEATSYSVTAIDGYLRTADVWLDINRNFILDGNEPKATTEKGGVAVLVTTGIDNPEQYPVIVEAKEHITVDEDDIDPVSKSGGEVTHSFTMSAPAGEKNITPLSTQVHLKMVQGKMAKNEAIKQVADSLGLKAEGLLADYIAPETYNAANAFAARNIVDSQLLPTSAADLNVITYVPESEQAQNYAKKAAAVNETIKAVLEKTNEAGGDPIEVVDPPVVVNPPADAEMDTDGDGVPDNIDAFPTDPNRHLPDVFDPSADPELDTDGDGVPDHIDAFPTDPGRYLPSDKLGYTTWYMGSQVISSEDNIGTVITNDAKHFTGTTAGKAMWFYTPINANFRLSALGDFGYGVNEEFTGNVFTNIYVTPYNADAYNRISCFEFTNNTAAPLRDTGWNKDNPVLDTYVFSIVKGKTLNSTIKEINENKPGCTAISKADFKVLQYVDKPRADDNKDPEVTNGNFILKLGDGNYTGTEPFTINAYEMAKSYQISSNQKIVVANAVNVKQETTDSALTGDSYGKRVWIYPDNVGGDSIAPYAVIAPLSNYQNFRFETDHNAAFVSVYVVAKDGVAFDESQKVPGVFEPVAWAKAYQPEGKMVYKLTITGGAGSLKDTLTVAGRDVNELELINYLDGQDDGDLGMAGNFILKIGGSESVFADSFTVKEFTFSAPAEH